MKEDTHLTIKKNPKWTSRIGFIMTAAGAAVGLGNLQRFPTLVAMHGGGAFLLLYLICVILFGWPLMMLEMSLGRAMATDPINSFRKVVPKNYFWTFVGILGPLIAFSILSYYTVSCSWTLAFSLKNLFYQSTSFKDIIIDAKSNLIILIIFQVIITLIVLKGLNNGIEKFSKIVMPLLLIMQFILIFKILTIKGSFNGVMKYLKPDFTKLRSDSLLCALSQAFFSLCIGEAVLLTYGSFSKKEESLPMSTAYIAFLDTAVAFLAGLIIIPATFITSQDSAQGISLIYNTLFNIFAQMKYGNIFLFLYFNILAIAGLTTCISLLDVSSYSFSKLFNIKKSKSILIITLFSLGLALPSLYSKGASKFLTEIKFWKNNGFFEIMDFVWGSLGMVICGFLTTLFVGWKWGAKKACDELSQGSHFFDKIKNIWSFHIRWTAPIIILIILFTLLVVNN